MGIMSELVRIGDRNTRVEGPRPHVNRVNLSTIVQRLQQTQPKCSYQMEL